MGGRSCKCHMENVPVKSEVSPEERKKGFRWKCIKKPSKGKHQSADQNVGECSANCSAMYHLYSRYCGPCFQQMGKTDQITPPSAQRPQDHQTTVAYEPPQYSLSQPNFHNENVQGAHGENTLGPGMYQFNRCPPHTDSSEFGAVHTLGGMRIWSAPGAFSQAGSFCRGCLLIPEVMVPYDMGEHSQPGFSVGEQPQLRWQTRQRTEISGDTSEEEELFSAGNTSSGDLSSERDRPVGRDRPSREGRSSARIRPNVQRRPNSQDQRSGHRRSNEQRQHTSQDRRSGHRRSNEQRQHNSQDRWNGHRRSNEQRQPRGRRVSKRVLWSDRDGLPNKEPRNNGRGRPNGSNRSNGQGLPNEAPQWCGPFIEAYAPHWPSIYKI